MEMIIKVLEDVYEPTEVGWKQYKAGKSYKMEFSMAKEISKIGYGCFEIKPKDLTK